MLGVGGVLAAKGGRGSWEKELLPRLGRQVYRGKEGSRCLMRKVNSDKSHSLSV